MPTYCALGVTATLSVTDLQASQSNVFDLKQGQEQRSDAQRIHSVFANGRNLPERPIGKDGGDQGVQQFLGEQEDLPFFMVEAGEGVRRKPVADVGLKEEGTAESQQIYTDSPLSSLEVTPDDSTPSRGAHESLAPVPITPGPSRSRRKNERMTEYDTDAPENQPAQTFSGFERARGFLSQATGAQALCLTIETCNRSFLARPDSRSKASGKDLKLEIFVNGQLAGSSLINRRGAAIELVDGKVRYQGTRIHRQMEKPWVYDVKVGDQYDVGTTVGKRWQAISEALKHEADGRGRNKWGDHAPSAELLLALSKMALPKRLANKPHLGIVDVIITAGAGKKYGPEGGYLLGPTRMDDHDYSTFNLAPDPFSNDMMLLGNAAEDASPIGHNGPMALAGLAASSPEVPLIRQRSAAALPETPTRKKEKVIDLTEDLRLDDKELDQIVEGYENSRGKTGQRRTVRQRLNDIKQMNPQNQEKHLAALREQLGEAELRAMKKEAVDDNGFQPSPSKKAKLDPSCDFGLSILAEAALLGNGIVDPRKLFRATPPPAMLPDGADPDAVLTQSRIDMALEAGAQFSGPLLRRIASSSPQRTPKKKTRASSLANSPCSVPVKEPPSKGKQTPTTPQCSVHFHNGSPIPIDPALTGGAPTSSAKRSVRGANRTRKAWDPKEHTAQDALKAFEVPELCKGSVVTYAEGDAQRQIGKARNGEFKEETLVVGMRFVVV